MQNRLLSALFTLILLLSLPGCAVMPQDGSTTVPAFTASPDVVQSMPAETSAYAYEHALRIIDDHYRNFYEIFVASFYDSNGDGIGDLKGIIQKLDYINDGNDLTDVDLGFNGIWLMPIMPSPSYHKYDTTDLCGVDPAYGTQEDFKNLLEECHARGITLIIDFMINHTSVQHPWFLQAVSYYETLAPDAQPDYEDCPYAGYYHFSTEKAGVTGWHRAGRSAWYYEGKFSDRMPDLALENEAVRREIEQAASFWLELGVDGFRLDAVKEYVSGSPATNIEVLSWFNDYVLSVNANAFLVGEAWEPVSVGLAPYYTSGVASFFNFPLAQATGSVAAVIRKGDGEKLAAILTQSAETYGAVNPNLIDAPFLSNHDTSRISAHYMNDIRKMKLAAGLLLTMSGSPFVYYGEELGMNSLGDRDENKRLPMHWSDTDRVGTPNPPAGADDVEQKFPALDVQRNDPYSLFHYYRRALRIRNENPGIARGAAEAVEVLTAGAVCAVLKTYDEDTLLLIYNIGEQGIELSLGGTEYAAYALYGYLTVDEERVTLTDTTLWLPSYAIAVLRP